MEFVNHAQLAVLNAVKIRAKCVRKVITYHKDHAFLTASKDSTEMMFKKHALHVIKNVEHVTINLIKHVCLVRIISYY